MPLTPSESLEVFDNPHPDRYYEVLLETDEFTSLCPLTGQPDFASLAITYVPNKVCVELKSFKQYLWSYREKGLFHEDAANRILKDLVAALKPRFLEVEGDFKIRGGIRTTIRTSYIEEEEDE